MNRFILAVGFVLSPTSLLLIDATIKGVALLCVAACVAMLLRRDSAATRHLIWLVAIVTVLVVPVCSAFLPEWRVLPEWAAIPSEPAEHKPNAVVENTVTTTFVPDAANGELPTVSAPTGEPSVVLVEPQNDGQTQFPSAVSSVDPADVLLADPPKEAAAVVQSSWNWRSGLAVAWLCGLAVLVLRLVAARVMFWSSQRRGRIVHVTGTSTGNDASRSKLHAVEDEADGSLISVFENAVSQLQISQRVSLIIHPDRSIPLVWGLRTARLLLPEAARDWTTEQQKSVLLHELAHIKRRDTWTQLLAQTACAIYWFNPLIWFAAWRLHVERERACDDLVLNNGVAASAYAEHLLDVATRLTSSPWTQACGLAMTRRSSLEGRLTAVLSQKRNRRRATNMLIAVSLLIGGAIAIPLAMLKAEDTSQNEPADASVAKEPLKPWAYQGVDSALLRRWRQLEGDGNPIPESRVAGLRSAVGRFIDTIDQSPFSLTQQQTTELQTLRTRGADETQHTETEAQRLIGDIFAIHGEPVQMAFNEAPRPGTIADPKEFAELPFGPAAPNGLRVALICARKEFIFGDSSRLDIKLWNSGPETLVLGIGRNGPGLYPQLNLQATGQNGRSIATTTGPESEMLANISFAKSWQLRPGEVADVYGYRVRAGTDKPRETENWPQWYTMIELTDVRDGESIQLTGSLPSVSLSAAEQSNDRLKTGSVTIHATAPESVSVWTASRGGTWPMPGGVNLELKQECFHAADIVTSVVLTWPVDASGTTYAFETGVAFDAFGNREPWHVVWEKDSTTFWAMTGPLGRRVTGLATPERVQRVNFADKSNIITTTWYHQPAEMPEEVSLAFAKKFKPLPSEPHRSHDVNGFSQIGKAHDVRPIDELLDGTWKNSGGEVATRLTFPQHDTDGIEWTIDYGQPGVPVVDATVERINVPSENAIRLWMRPSSPGDDEEDVLGTLRRGPDSTLVLDIKETSKHPAYKQAGGIVLVRAPADEADVDRDGSK